MQWLSTIVMLTLVSPCLSFVPRRWGFRLWILIALLWFTTVLLQPELQFDDEGFLPPRLAVGTLSFILALPLVVLYLRQAHAERNGSVVAVQPGYASSERRVLGWFDHFIFAIGGLCAGLLLTLIIALALRGFPGGLFLHLAVATAAALGAGAVWKRLDRFARSVALPIFLVISGAGIFGGFYYPELVVRNAIQTSLNAPYCLRAVDQRVSSNDMMLLTLPRGQPGAPGLILTVMAPAGAHHYRWSYRAMDFTPYGAYQHGGCPL